MGRTCSPVTDALRDAGFVRLAPRWIRAEDLPVVQSLTDACAVQVEAVRVAAQKAHEAAQAADPRTDPAAAWAAFERDRGY